MYFPKANSNQGASWAVYAHAHFRACVPQNMRDKFMTIRKFTINKAKVIRI